MQKIILTLLHGYRYAIRPMMGRHCRFYPSCSEYAVTAVERYGALRGLRLAGARVLRCHPWHPGGFDPVPGDGESS